MYKFKLNDGKELELPVGEATDPKAKKRTAAKFLADTWKNHGFTPEGDYLEFGKIVDLISTTEMSELLPIATEWILREPVEPILAITSLYTRVMAKGLSQNIVMGALGAIAAGDADEGGNYPEVSFDTGGAVTTATIGKSGIQASFTDEALRYIPWDIMAIQLRLMRQAVLRHTEYKAIKFLLAMGQVLFDNANPTSSLFGVTTGRAMDGSANGSLIMDDILTAYTHMVETGYTPDTLVMSPQFYFMWVKDPVLKYLFMEGSGRGVYFATYTGNPAPLPNWSNGALGAMGPSNGYNVIPMGNAAGETATGLEETSPVANSAPVIPNYLGLPLRIIVSPLMPYDPTTKLGHIFLVASGRVGYHLIDEEPSTTEWRDEDRELIKVKIKQRDSFAVVDDGNGICVFRNVKNVENYYHGHVQLTQTVSGQITEIDPDTAVV